MDIINTASSVFKEGGGSVPTPVPTPTPTPVPTPTPTPVPTPTPTPVPTPTPTPVPTPTPTKWVAGKKYTKGQTVTYNGIKYTCNIDVLSCPPNVNAWSSEVNPTPNPTPNPIPNPIPTPNVQIWTIGVNYSQGQIVNYNGQTYRCLQNHTSLEGWTPAAVPALWLII
jgi:chitinase